MTLSAEHRDYLLRAAIRPEWVDELCETVPQGIAFHQVGPTGRRQTRIKLWPAPTERGEAKYIGPRGEPSIMPVAPGFQPLVDDPSVPLLIVEGTKGSLAGSSALVGTTGSPVAVVGLAGVDGWCEGDDEVQGRRPGPDLSGIPMRNRNVIICADADMESNRSVWSAIEGLTRWLRTFGAVSVRYMQLPGGGSISMDDVLARVPEDLREQTIRNLIVDARNSMPRQPARNRNSDGPFGTDGYSAARAADILITNGHLATGGASVLVYHEGKYHNGESKRFENLVIDLLGEDYTKTRFRDVEHAVISRLTGRGQVMPEFQTEFLIPFRNGLLDPVTMQLHPHRPSFRTQRQFQVEWDEDARAPFYEEWCAQRLVPGTLDDLEETVAQMLDMTRAPEKGLILFGPSRSGKGTYSRLVEAVAGQENLSAVSLHALSDNRFAAADLYGKSLNSYGDLSSSDVRDISTLKMALGFDAIRGERKGVDAFHFRNTALMLFAANALPAVSEASQAYFARIKPFEFPATFLDDGIDADVERRLQAELQGVAVRWVQALMRLRGRGRFQDTHQETDQKFRQGSDRIAQFVAENCRLRTGFTPRSAVWSRFKLWNDGGASWGRNSFYKRVENVDGVQDCRDGHGVRGYDFVLVDPERDGSGSSGSFGAGSGLVIGSGGSGGAGKSQDSVTESDAGSDGESESGSFLAVLAVPADFSYSPLTHTHSDSTLIDSKNGVVKKLPELPELPEPPCADPVIFDLETTGIDGLHTTDPGFVRIVGVEDAGSVEVVDPTIGDKVLGGYLADGHPLVAHNGFQFDFLAMQRRGVLDVLTHGDAGYLIDSKVLALLNDPPSAGMRTPRRYYGLDETAQRVAGIGKTDDLKGLAKEFGGFDKIPVDDERYVAYCKGDVVATRAMFDRLEMNDYAKREMRVMARLSGSITGCGFRVDLPLLEERLAQGRAARLEQIQWLADEIGLPMDSKSPQATKVGKEILDQAFTDRGVTLPRTPAGDAPSLSKVTLEEFLTEVGEDHPAAPLAAAVLALNGVRTVYGTVDDYRVGDRVYPEVNAFQASGRFSIQNPGLTVFGKRGGKFVEREVFLPEPGEVLCAFDLNQVDARAVAMHSQDPAYMALFQDPSIDSHTEIAKMVFGDPSRRNESKVILHSWSYGSGVRSIAARNGLPLSVVEEFDASMRAQFPVLVTWRDGVRDQAATGALMDNGFGRMMRPEPDRSWTQGPALMGQGLARDLMAEGILRMPLGVVARLKAVVHDEIVLSVPLTDLEDYKRVILAALEFEHMNVPVTAGFEGYGDSWGACYAKH